MVSPVAESLESWGLIPCCFTPPDSVFTQESVTHSLPFTKVDRTQPLLGQTAKVMGGEYPLQLIYLLVSK